MIYRVAALRCLVVSVLMLAIKDRQGLATKRKSFSRCSSAVLGDSRSTSEPTSHDSVHYHSNKARACDKFMGLLYMIPVSVDMSATMHSHYPSRLAGLGYCIGVQGLRTNAATVAKKQKVDSCW